jgi:hypothetical protein
MEECVIMVRGERKIGHVLRFGCLGSRTNKLVASLSSALLLEKREKKEVGNLQSEIYLVFGSGLGIHLNVAARAPGA